MIIDGTNLIIGRLGTYVAKKALLGEEIFILNSENVVITGKKDMVIKKYLKVQERGTHKGPFLPKLPNRFVRRSIRGMLPYKRERGKAAYKRIKCYMGVPEEFQEKKMERIKSADVSKLPNLHFITVKNICKRLGAKIE
ncbi:MAG: 50S ribosomal protein L13 [Nanoarchaeota archaeon]